MEGVGTTYKISFSDCLKGNSANAKGEFFHSRFLEILHRLRGRPARSRATKGRDLTGKRE
jgi:hypothetical protein